MKIRGNKIKDAKKEIALTITNRDCRLGNSKEPSTCAAARALCRQEHVAEALVHLSRTYLKRGEVRFRYETPPALRSEIVSFDRGGGFEPGEYRLIPPRPSFRGGSKRKSGKSGTHPQRGNKGHRHIVSGVRQRVTSEG